MVWYFFVLARLRQWPGSSTVFLQPGGRPKQHCTAPCRETPYAILQTYLGPGHLLPLAGKQFDVQVFQKWKGVRSVAATASARQFRLPNRDVGSFLYAMRCKGGSLTRLLCSGYASSSALIHGGPSCSPARWQCVRHASTSEPASVSAYVVNVEGHRATVPVLLGLMELVAPRFKHCGFFQVSPA